MRCGPRREGAVGNLSRERIIERADLFLDVLPLLLRAHVLNGLVGLGLALAFLTARLELRQGVLERGDARVGVVLWLGLGSRSFGRVRAPGDDQLGALLARLGL